MSNRIQIELKNVRLLNITKIGGYSGSAIFPLLIVISIEL